MLATGAKASVATLFLSSTYHYYTFFYIGNLSSVTINFELCKTLIPSLLVLVIINRGV